MADMSHGDVVSAGSAAASRSSRQTAQTGRKGRKPGMLSKREIEILCKVREGLSSQDICNQLFIERTTLKSHIHNVCKRFQVSNRHAALQYAVAHGLLASATDPARHRPVPADHP